MRSKFIKYNCTKDMLIKSKHQKIKYIFFYGLLFFCMFSYSGIVGAQTLQATSTKLEELNGVVANKEIEVLEKTISILDKTNTSLTQQWTPMSVLLSITAGLFALVTLLWAGLFAWGYLIFRKIATDKKKMAGEMKKLSVEGKKILEDIDINGKKIFAEVEEKSKSLPELQREFGELREKASQAIERLEDKTIGTISGSSQGVYGEVNFGNSLFGGNRTGAGYTFGSMSNSLNNLKVCSKCGNVFKESDSLTTLSGFTWSSQMFSENVLCKKCKEEEKT